METIAALRESVVEIGRRMYAKNLIAGTDGNISCRLPESRILITPTGSPKGRLSPHDLVIIDERGSVVSGSRKPSSEFRLHTYIYSVRSDIDAVVHGHPVFCTAYAAAGKPLAAAILPEIVLSVRDVPLAEYGTPSTPELPGSIEGLIGSHDAILMRNHGVVVMGKNLEEAYNRLETVEHFAMILHASETLGGANPLSDEQVARLSAMRDTASQDSRDHE
jgi:L-fuculose-phosphate aldolase